MENINERDTVTIDESVHDIYKQLTEGTDPVAAPFRTMKDVFMWAAVLGYQNGKRRSITGKKVTIFRWAQFSEQTDIPLIESLAIAESKDVKVLLSQEYLITIVEEYANVGIHQLKHNILDEPGQSLWNLVNFINL